MKKSIILFAIAVGITSVIACNKEKTSNTANRNVTIEPVLPEVTANYFTSNSSISGNTYLASKMATVGRVLFYDKHLSINNAISCGSCHKQALAFADNLKFSHGFENRPTGRNTPALQNVTSLFFTGTKFSSAGGTSLFWDGRETNLFNLIMRPVSNHVEMGIDNLDELPAKLSELPYYSKLFKDAYGDDKITLDRISECVALFVSAINTTQSRADLAQKGMVQLTALESFGKMLFDTKYPCGQCHEPETPGGYSGFGSGTEFMDIGLDYTVKDDGRAAITGRISDKGKFKIPDLHNAALTAPYMHDGRFKTLEEVIDHYNTGIENSSNLNPELKDANEKPMRMNISTDEKVALIAFLKSMTDYEMITDPKFSDPFQSN